MRIVLCFPGFHRRGGVERITVECGLFLRDRGHDVRVLAHEWDEELEGLSFRHVPMREKPWFLRAGSFFQSATERLQDEAFDVLNTHGVECPTGGVLWVQSVQKAWLHQSKQMRAPFSASRWKQRFNPLHPALLRLEEEHYARRNYRKLIVTTPAVRDDLNCFYGVPTSDVEIVPNGFNPLEFNPQVRAAKREAKRRELGLKNDDLALLFVANELERKGFPVLLDAVRKLGDPRIKIVTIGRSPVAQVLEMASQRGVRDQVLACGATNSVSDFHAGADLFVLPTQYEAFCLAILESLGSGLPVITTKVPGAGDTIEHGANGLLMNDPKNADELVAHLEQLRDQTTRHEFSVRAARSSEPFQWPKVLARYEAILEQNRR